MRIPNVRRFGEPVVGVLHRRILPVEGKPHQGIEERERQIGFVVVEDAFQVAAPRGHPESPVEQPFREDPLDLVPRRPHGFAIESHAPLGI
jgi:hypothetical protein